MKPTLTSVFGLPALQYPGCVAVFSKDMSKIARIPEAAAKSAESALREAGFLARPQPRPSGPFQLALLVTTRCNLRCSYCYAGSSNRGDGAMMSPSLASQAVHQLVPNGRRVNVHFIGGEPSLNLPAVKAAVDTARSLYPGVTFSATTNGVMPQNAVTWLVENDFHLSVSLDGPQPVHDAQRPCPNGMSSFAAATSTLSAAVQAGRPVKVRVTVTPNGLSEIVSFLSNLAAMGVRLVQLSPVEHVGRSSGISYKDSYIEAYSELIYRAWQVASYLGISILTTSSLNLGGNRQRYCHAGDHEERVIVTAEGDLTSCFAVNRSEHPAAASFHYAHLDATHGLMQNAPQKNTYRSLAEKAKRFCRECSAHHYCRAGCLLQVALSGEHLPDFCRLNRAVFGATLSYLADAELGRRGDHGGDKGIGA